MQKKILLSLLVILIFPCAILFSKLPESQILERSGIKSSACADANSARSGENEYLTESPAAAADIFLPRLSLSYGDIRGYNKFLNLTYTQPTDSEVISANIKYFKAKEKNNGIDQALNLNVTFSLIFSEKLLAGIGLNFLNAGYYGKKESSFSLNLGTIYSFYDFTENRKNRFIENIKFGLSLLNIGKPIIFKPTAVSESETVSPPVKIETGPSLILNINKNIKSIISADLEAARYQDTGINLGIDNIFVNKYSLRFGYAINSDYRNLSLGAGYKFKIFHLIPEINYTSVFLKDNLSLHYLGIEIQFNISHQDSEMNNNNDNPDDKTEMDNLIKSRIYLDHYQDKFTALEKKEKTEIIAENKKSPEKAVIPAPLPDKQPSRVQLQITPENFFPDNNEDSLKFNVKVQDESRINRWVFTIYEQTGNKQKEVFKSIRKQGMPPEEITWNGKNDKGVLVQSKNRYYLDLEIWDQAENKAVLKDKEITISKELPDVDMTLQPKLFSPDNDGNNDTLFISMNSARPDKIKSWQLDIFSIKPGNTKTLFKQFSGTTLPSEPIPWDGKDQKGKAVESAADYLIRLTVENILGSSKTIEKNLHTGLLVLRKKNMIKPLINNIENIKFEHRKSTLTEEARKMLVQLETIMNKYPDFKIIIEGHTDSTGSRDYNINLSKERALSVYNYLIENGINEKRLLIKNFGDSIPIAPNKNPDGTDNPYGRTLNRRFELVLIKTN